MQRIHYDFSGLERSIGRLKDNQSKSTLDEIKKELNKFYKDSNCYGVLYTKNTDKMFFGMCVMPILEDDIVTDLLSDKSFKRISRYYIEIDSKLLDMGFTTRELTAMILHEIGHIVNDTSALREVQNSTHSYLVKEDEIINVDMVLRNIYLFKMAICDSLRTFRSLFKRKDEEIIADEFSVRCGYGRDLESAYKRIVRNVNTISNENSNKLITLQWCLRIYKDMGIRRIGAIKILNKAYKLTPSELQKRDINNVSKQLNSVYSEGRIVNESLAISNFKKKFETFRRNMRYNGLRQIEDELYEFNLKAKNIDDHDDVLAIIRQINERMCIIEDYINTEKMSESEKKRWFDILNKYRLVREEISKKKTYDDKYYGLFVKMPEIKPRYNF